MGRRGWDSESIGQAQTPNGRRRKTDQTINNLYQKISVSIRKLSFGPESTRNTNRTRGTRLYQNVSVCIRKFQLVPESIHLVQKIPFLSVTYKSKYTIQPLLPQKMVHFTQLMNSSTTL